MTRNITEIIERVIRAEGSTFTNNPNDSGGPTKYGITQAALSEYRKRIVTAQDVSDLSADEARRIYYARYIDTPRFDMLIGVSLLIAEEVIDTGVNIGPPRATEFLQRALNALNRQGRDYADIRVDMQCGPSTLAALRAFISRRGGEGEIVMRRALNCLQGAFYIGLAERRPKDEEFLYGWLLNRVAS